MTIILLATKIEVKKDIFSLIIFFTLIVINKYSYYFPFILKLKKRMMTIMGCEQVA